MKSIQLNSKDYFSGKLFIPMNLVFILFELLTDLFTYSQSPVSGNFDY